MDGETRVSVGKAFLAGKKVILVNEFNTSLSCSTCGKLEKPNDRIKECSRCCSIFDRDINAAKNIYMKGILS
jgi:transposase